MVTQSSFACLGEGHTRWPHVGFSRSQFSLFACESSRGPVPGQANMRNCLARLRHIWVHMMSHRRRELRLQRARHPVSVGPPKCRGPHSDVVGCSSATHPSSLATVATPGTTSDLHRSSVASKLGCSIRHSRVGRGMSVDVSDCFLCVGRRTRASVHGGNKDSWQTMTPQWPRQTVFIVSLS